MIHHHKLTKEKSFKNKLKYRFHNNFFSLEKYHEHTNSRHQDIHHENKFKVMSPTNKQCLITGHECGI